MAETTNIKISQIEVNKGQIEGLPKNPRFVKDDKFKKLVKSIEENPEMLGYRELLVYPHGGKYVVIGGNMRLRACKQLGYKEIPCKVLPQDTTIEQLKAYTIKDNSGFGEWDFDLLANEWDIEELTNWGLDIDFPTIEDVQEVVEDDEINEADVPSRCAEGEVWSLGRHRLMCGSSTNADDVAKLTKGEKMDLVFTDPPYGMKKEKDGVLNDNLNFDDLLSFNKKWIPLSFSCLKDNGSWYCWGIDEPLMDIYSEILKPMQKANLLTFRNLITWHKNPSGCGDGMNNPTARSFGKITEKCLFVMCGVEGFNNNSDHYFEGWESIRTYLEGEANKVGLNANKVKEICGVGMYSHWFTKSQWGLIPQEHYVKLQYECQGQAFQKEYEEIKKEYEEIQKEYEEIKKEYYATRAYFDNTHDNMTEVWHFDRTSKEERELCGGHATPKPIALCARAIKTSSRENERVLDLFGGSGSTLIACEQTNRNCYMMELDPHYCDVIIARWEQYTGRKAQLLNEEHN